MARDVVVATRRAGGHPQFLGADSIGGDTFPQLFQLLPEERQNTGYFVDGMYAASPIIFDSANDTAQKFFNDYRRAYGRDPGWPEAKYYDVAHIVVDAIRNASPALGDANRDTDRERVREALAAMNSPQTAVNTTTGPSFFDNRNSMSQPVRIGHYVRDQFVSAPVQLVAVTNPEGLNIPDALAAGTVARLGDQYAWRQRVVYTGIDVNQISAIDESRGVFTADLYLWFLYTGDDSVLDVEILNSAGANFDPKDPLAADEVGGLHHRLYRVRGDFKVDYDLHEYPFDRQFLAVQIQNVHLSRDQVIYAIDAASRRLALSRDADANPLRGLNSWALQDIRLDETTSRTISTRGYATEAGLSPLSEYSTREVTITAQRRTSIFLVKTLLPLALLTSIVFTTLFLSVDDGFEARTLDASALLAAAVLLVAINQSIRAGYTIAIEYAFFVFFGLCLFCMVVHLADERLQETRHGQRARRVHVWSRLVYALVVAALVGVYALKFGSRFI
jgi:branched-chain amino acid transport system substrate-binding protein